MPKISLDEPILDRRDFFFFFFFFLFGFISLILSRVNRKVGQKQEIPEKNHQTIHKQNLAYLTRDPSKTRTHNGEMTSDLEPSETRTYNGEMTSDLER